MRPPIASGIHSANILKAVAVQGARQIGDRQVLAVLSHFRARAELLRGGGGPQVPWQEMIHSLLRGRLGSLRELD